MSQDLYSDNFSGTLDTAHARMVKARKLKSETTAKIYSIINELFGIPCDTKPIEFSPVFKFYTDEEQSNSLFKNTFEKLNATKGTINKNDCWNFYDLMEIITNNKISPSRKDLKFLITECKIPERHIHHKYKYFDHGFDNVWLSRYGAYLMISTAANKIIRDSNDFSYEKMAFARSYFAFADCELSDLIQPTWDFIRGEKLKTISDIFQARIGNLIKLFNGRVFYFEVKDLLHNHIFDTLFATAYKPNELQSFEKIYKQVIKNSKTNSPIPYIAPHIMIFLSEQIDKFCDYIYKSIKEDATFVGSNKLDALAAKFFIQTRYQLELSKRANKNIDSLFTKKSLFSEYHQSVSFENINSIEKGSGRSHIDNWGIKFRDTEGISFYRDQHLFSNDEIWVMEVKKSYENNLINIYHDISTKKKTVPECADKIKELKQKITSENMNLYGIDIPEFLNIQLCPGNLFSKQLSLDLFDNKTPEQLKNTNKKTVEPISDNNKDLPSFKILKNYDINIPRGIPFSKQLYTGWKTNKKGQKVWVINEPYFSYDINGNLESTNPLKEKPKKLNKRGFPTNADENFEMQKMVIECDHLSIPEQIAQAKRIMSDGLGICELTESGNKSIHMTIAFKYIPKTREEYKWLYWHIIEKYNIHDADPACCHNGRLKRKPGADRIIEIKDGNEQISYKTVKQKLIHLTNDSYDFDWRPAYQAYKIEIQQEYEMRKKITYNYSRNEIQKFYAGQVSFLLGGWIEGSRYSTLMKGIIPKMVKAGFTEKEILDHLPINSSDRDLERVIKTFIDNAFSKYNFVDTETPAKNNIVLSFVSNNTQKVFA